MTTATFELTDKQQQAVEGAVKILENRTGMYRIGGYAGTGKTSIAHCICEDIEGGMICAFTGKAAYRLMEKGLYGAQTIHRTIYTYDESINEFILKPSLPGRFFLIDEGSMVSYELWRDVQSYGLPVVLLGDPGQLEPVGKNPHLMRDPDIVLDQIHRQAAESGIIQFATDVRKERFTQFHTYNDVDIQIGQKTIHKDVLAWADVVLCGFNRTRIKLNKQIRKMQGFKGLLNPGERIICLQNNYHQGVFNGQMLTVKEIVKDGSTIIDVKCETDDGQTLKLALYKSQFNNAKVERMNYRELVLADYGYCITVHKSQGSEWDRVCVIDEQCPKLWSPVKWRYTAITRAAKELKYIFKD